MKSIEIDDDIYSYLLSKTAYIGESATSILRRVLSLGGTIQKAPPPAVHELSQVLNGAALKFGSATEKFLAILAEVHKKNAKDFEKVLAIKGRDRVYFAKSREEIARSGRSTQPLQIPGTPYWVMTNSPTPQKRTMLRQVLQLLGYSEPARADAARAIS
jgi:negative modulator of initiation of replication